MAISADGRLRVTYRLLCDADDDPEVKARDIALEQTVELPDHCLSSDDERRMVGCVESIERGDEDRWQAVISFPPELVAADVLQLANVLFGNVSLKHGILLSAVEWPGPLVQSLGGPHHGIEGLRALCGVGERRPLLCVALKPVGLSARRLADRCYQFALAGVDLVKDDHGLADQQTAPFAERVPRCAEAVERANAETGGQSRYFPNLTGPLSRLEHRLEILTTAGCRGALLSPFLVGFDTVRWIGRHTELAILSHPALAGSYFGDTHGIAPDLLLGSVFRLIGSDGVIYPNVGGRFRFSEETCRAINARLREPLGAAQPAFPVPGGGIDVARVPEWIGRYGVDTVLLIGASLYGQPDRPRATRNLVDAVRTLPV